MQYGGTIVTFLQTDMAPPKDLPGFVRLRVKAVVRKTAEASS